MSLFLGTLSRHEVHVIFEQSFTGGLGPPHPSDTLAEQKCNETQGESIPAAIELDRFRMLVDSVVDYAVFMLDTRGLVTTWNLGAERIKGYEPSEIIGKHFSIFYPSEALAEDLPARELYVAARDGHYHDEGWRVRKDGTKLWASVVISALRTPDGTLVGFGKVTRDLTDRRISEEALRESNRVKTAYATSLNSILDATIFSAIIATDPDGTITVFNRGAERMLGYTAAEVVGKHTPALFHVAEEVENRGAALSKVLHRAVHGFDVFRSAIGQEGYDQLEWTYIHKDGHPITVRLSLSERRGDTANQPIGYLGVAWDVTEERRAAAEAKSAYLKLSSVLEYTSDSVLTIGRDWTLLYGNRRTMDMLPDFAVGKSYWDCFPAVIGTPLEGTLHAAMESGTATSYEIFYEPYQQWFRGRIFPTDSGLSLFYADCTKEKQIQEQLELEQVLREKRIEALSHMAGGLAHEISNPLAIIYARAQDLKALVVQGGVIPSETISEACDSIVKTADRATRILRGLRGFGREAGSDSMEWASFYDIVEGCLELQQDRFNRHHIRLDLELKPDIPLVLCRETQIGQILTNLLNNGFDTIDQSRATERWVRLTATSTEDNIVVHVEDSGPGIEEKFRPHLMDAFFTTKTAGLGMGVGLSLSRAIAHDHGGSLTLCPDTGSTCFALVLPITHDESPEKKYAT